MSRKPMVVNPGCFIFKKQTIRGFWLLHWYQSAKTAEITAMFDHLTPLIAAGTISTPSLPPTVSTNSRKRSRKQHRAAARCCSRRKPDSPALRAALHNPLFLCREHRA
jgi:hypothetical protein